jgi:hypothetical protein
MSQMRAASKALKIKLTMHYQLRGQHTQIPDIGKPFEKWDLDSDSGANDFQSFCQRKNLFHSEYMAIKTQTH